MCCAPDSLVSESEMRPLYTDQGSHEGILCSPLCDTDFSSDIFVAFLLLFPAKGAVQRCESMKVWQEALGLHDAFRCGAEFFGLRKG